MSKKKRKNYTPEQKVIILKKHLLEKVSNTMKRPSARPTTWSTSGPALAYMAAVSSRRAHRHTSSVTGIH